MFIAVRVFLALEAKTSGVQALDMLVQYKGEICIFDNFLDCVFHSISLYVFTRKQLLMKTLQKLSEKARDTALFSCLLSEINFH